MFVLVTDVFEQHNSTTIRSQLTILYLNRRRYKCRG